MTTYRLNYRPSGPIDGGLFQKYPGEHHFPFYSYLGPGTRLDLRLDENMKPKKGEEPRDSLDAIALRHDIAYQKIQNEYKQDKTNKQKYLNKVHDADEEFIKEASNSNVQPLGKIAANIIKGKEELEKRGYIDSKTFSGLGSVNFKTKNGKTVSFTKKPKKKDPTERLKRIAGIHKPEHKKRKQRGGFGPLAVGVISALAGTALGKVFDLVKEKLSGKGFMLDPRVFETEHAKRRLLHHLIQ